jgi:hypothetical protein
MRVMTRTSPHADGRHDTLNNVTSRGSDRKSFREPDDDIWREFVAAAQIRHRDGASGVIREFIRWYLEKPDAELPERPAGQIEKS